MKWRAGDSAHGSGHDGWHAWPGRMSPSCAAQWGRHRAEKLTWNSGPTPYAAGSV